MTGSGGGGELFEHCPVAAYEFCVVEDEFVLQQVNAAALARNPGIAALVGKPMAALYRDQPEIVAAARRCVREGTPVVLEQPVRRYDRTEATQNLRLTLVSVPTEHMVLFLEDVASSEVAATALHESEARYESLVAALPDAVLLRGSDGRVLACNVQAMKLFGAAREAELLGETNVLPAGWLLRTESGEALEDGEFPGMRALETGQSESVRSLQLLPPGQSRWLRVAAAPVRSQRDTVAGSAAIFTDVTDRFLAQQALAESARRLDLALAAGRVGVFEIDLHTDVGWWSPNLDEVFALADRGRGLGGFIERVPPEDRGALVELSQKLLQGTVETFDLGLRLKGSDGMLRWARLRGQLRHDGGRSVVSGTVTDVTQQRELEEELVRSHRLQSIGRLAGGVAHDFNNLLSAMLGSLELMGNECPPSTREEVGTLRHAVLRARELTQQLLAFARRHPVALEDVELTAVVRRVERLLRRLVRPNIEIVVEDPTPTFVRADPAQLEQVLVNLGVNASEAMPDGGRLTMRVGRRRLTEAKGELAGDLAVLEVADTGVGIDEATRAHLFEPFFTTKERGTGLGLASCYGIVRQHGGDIVVDSTPGGGTRFEVLLPRLDQAPTWTPPEAAPAVTTGEGTVLVVDDDPLVRQISARLVQSLGYRVEVADSAEQALAVASAQAQGVDILLCDVAMPGRDGPSVARELVARIPGLRVVFVSGYHRPDYDPLLPGASFLLKPYSRWELGTKLAEALQDPRRR